MLIHHHCDIGVLANIAMCDHENRNQIIHIVEKRLNKVLQKYMDQEGEFNIEIIVLL